MIKENPFKLIWGIWAIGIYTMIVILLLFYFNSRSDEKSKHFVKKDEQRIQVAFSSPHKAPKAKPVKKKAQPEKKRKVNKKVSKKEERKPKKRVKKASPKKSEKKKIIKEKITRKASKKKDENRTKKKREKVSTLFANVKPVKKNIIQVTEKPAISQNKHNVIEVSEKPLSASERISSSLKIRKSSDSGIENIYFAKVEEKLKGWPAQSDYAGEKAKVWLKIDPSGYFEFKVISASNNEDFNTGLIAYLEQLQRFGFGVHKGKRPYELEVEFVATQ